MSEERTMYGHPLVPAQGRPFIAAQGHIAAGECDFCGCQDSQLLDGSCSACDERLARAGTLQARPATPPTRPDADDPDGLDMLANLVQRAGGDYLDCTLDGARIAVAETLFQAACILRRDGQVDLPYLGHLAIAYGEHGQEGRLILAPEARP